jgi:hypothetical protein
MGVAPANLVTGDYIGKWCYRGSAKEDIIIQQLIRGWESRCQKYRRVINRGEKTPPVDHSVRAPAAV